MNDEDLEHTLKSLRWRSAKPDFLEHTLAAALAERQTVAQVTDLGGTRHRKPQRRSLATLLAFIPKPLRLPLTACWLLSLFFKLNTPDPISPQTRALIAQMPEIDPLQMLAKLEEEQQRTAHLMAYLEQYRRRPAATREVPITPVLP